MALSYEFLAAGRLQVGISMLDNQRDRDPGVERGHRDTEYTTLFSFFLLEDKISA